MSDSPTISRTPDNLVTSLTLMARLEQKPNDPIAWTAVVRRYGPSILAWARGYGVNGDDAEEITQMVLTRLLERMRSFRYDPQRSFRSYLKTLTRYAWCDLVAARGRQPKLFSESADDPIAEIAAHDDLVGRLSREFDLELLENAMSEVQSRVETATWRAFQMLAMEKRSGMEVAKELGLSIANVYKARSNVQKMLRDIIQSANAGENDDFG